MPSPRWSGHRKAYVDALPHCLVSESTTRAARCACCRAATGWMSPARSWRRPSRHFSPHLRSPPPPLRAHPPRPRALAGVAGKSPHGARTFVNRLWAQFFGTALSRVPSDLGAQGETPPNGPLLDWLACEFMDSGWDVKHLVRTIVTSATYRQSSVATPAQLAADPANREHARQSRFRVEAELVRDIRAHRRRPALAADRRPEREALSTGALLGDAEFSDARLRGGPRRGAVSARALRVVAALVFASEPARVRCAEPRGVRGRARSLQSPATGARAPQRPDLRGGRARVRRPHCHRRRRDHGAAPRVGVVRRAPTRSAHRRSAHGDRAVDRATPRLPRRSRGGRCACSRRAMRPCPPASTAPNSPPGRTSRACSSTCTSLSRANERNENIRRAVRPNGAPFDSPACNPGKSGVGESVRPEGALLRSFRPFSARYCVFEDFPGRCPGCRISPRWGSGRSTTRALPASALKLPSVPALTSRTTPTPLLA
jgi:hypothetical protein